MHCAVENLACSSEDLAIIIAAWTVMISIHQANELRDLICDKLGEPRGSFTYIPAFFKPGSAPKVVILSSQAYWSEVHDGHPFVPYDPNAYSNALGSYTVGPFYSPWYEKILSDMDHGSQPRMRRHMLQQVGGCQHQTWREAIEAGLVAIAMVRFTDCY